MENRMTQYIKRFALFGLLLAFSLALSAQRAGPRGGGRLAVGSGSHGFAPRVAARASAFAPVYAGYAPSYGYGFGMPYAYETNPYPENPNGGPQVIVSAPPGQPEPTVVYIPSYMRENNGPSLGEIAAQLKTEHQSSKYIWRNVEPPLLQPK
jgi:hypothetical protein